MLTYERSCDVVEISGEQASEYLQGQISQEVEKLAVGASSMSFVLDPRGRVESLFRLTRLELEQGEDRFIADVPAGQGEALMESLARFVLNTRVSFELSSRTLISLRATELSELEEPSELENARSAADEGRPAPRVVRSLWPGEPASFDEIAASPPDGSAASDGAAEIFEWLRITRGLPVIGSEIEVGAIPNETGLLDIAVDFDKGCYRGQELVERINSRSGGRREIRRLLSVEPLAAGSEVALANESAAQVLSATDRPPNAPTVPPAGDWPAGDQPEPVQEFNFAAFALCDARAESTSVQANASILSRPIGPGD